MKTQTLVVDKNIEPIEIGHKMHMAGLSGEFVSSAVRVAFEFEGVYDLMKLWADETDEKEKNEIVADIQDMIDECSQKEKIEGTYIRFDDLGQIAKNIRSFKDQLRLIVERNGGIKALATLTGIPQPSLSRFFSSSTMPRRVTLLKIARALKLSQVQIATEWSR
jgi:DNA-binding phage protein